MDDSESGQPQSVLYSGPSRVTHTHSSGSVDFKSTTMTTLITRMDSDRSEPTGMFEGDAMHDEV